MSRMEAAPEYDVPSGDLGLKGPVERPAPGTLPLRGDLAHIALATRFLVPHYVVPQPYRVKDDGAVMRLTPQQDADIVMRLDGDSLFEVLDLAGGWYWGCVGPEGPSGYIAQEALVALST
ncbi:MAG: hypothetical protein WA948_02045 [Pontixanthobacter sp.]